MQKNWEILNRDIARFEAAYGSEELGALKDRPTGRHFSELVIMGMIRPKPSDRNSPTEAQRLSITYSAIYRSVPDTRANERGADHGALAWMAEIREMQQREIDGGRQTKLDSDFALARRAAAQNKKTSGPNHLRTKFPAFVAERNKRVDPDKEDDVEDIQRAALDILEDLFSLFGVPFYADE